MTENLVRHWKCQLLEVHSLPSLMVHREASHQVRTPPQIILQVWRIDSLTFGISASIGPSERAENILPTVDTPVVCEGALS